ncbi:uncharacterized protein LOC144115095 isoform X1 [Amblyomma americanum]
MSGGHYPVQQQSGWNRIRRRPRPYERPTPRYFSLDWPETDTSKKAEDNVDFHCDNLAAEPRASGSAVTGNHMSTPTHPKTQAPVKPSGEYRSRRMSLAVSSPVIDFLAAAVPTSENANEVKIEKQSPRKKSDGKHSEIHHEHKPSDVLPVSYLSSAFEMTIPEEYKLKPRDHSTHVLTAGCDVNTSVTNRSITAVRPPTSFPADICRPTEDAQEMNNISTMALPEKRKSKRAYSFPLKGLELCAETQKHALSTTMEDDPRRGIDIPLVKHEKGQILAEDILAHAPSPKRSHKSSEHQTERVEPIAIFENSRKTSGEQPLSWPEIPVGVEETQGIEKRHNGETSKTKGKKRKKTSVPVQLYDSSDGQRGKDDVTLYDVYLSLATEMIEDQRKQCTYQEGKEVLKMLYEEVVRNAARAINAVQRRHADKLHKLNEERDKIRAQRKEFYRLGGMLKEYIEEKNIPGVHPYEFCFTEDDCI